METGFIHKWRMADPAQNLMKVCSGSSAGDFVGFRLSDCCKPLADELRNGDIDGPSVCPPPPETPILQFDLEFRDGEFLAASICFEFERSAVEG
jgi:hypothetical protein